MNFEEFKSSDPRDKIYGLLCLVNWKTCTRRIQPDYSKSAFPLAVQAFESLQKIGNINRLLSVLKFHHSDPALQEAIRHRQQIAAVMGIQPVRSSNSTREEYSQRSRTIHRIDVNDHGQFTIVESQPASASHQAIDAKLLEVLQDSVENVPRAEHIFGDHKPTEIFMGSLRVFVACDATRRGDFLMRYNVPDSIPCHMNAICLGLRHEREDLFTIVGQAIQLYQYQGRHHVPPGPFDSSLEEAISYPVWSAVPEMKITNEDYVVLVGQDFMPNLGWDCLVDSHSRLRRLITNVTTQPYCAVRPDRALVHRRQ